MTKRILGSTLFTAAALFAWVGCTPSGTSGAPGGEAPQGPPAPKMENPEKGTESVGAPLVLELRGPDPVPQAGALALVADLSAPSALKIPVTVTVKLPAGATLASGQASEVLQGMPAGHTLRNFNVNLTGPLSEPVVVTVDGKDPGGAFGFHAEKKFPEPTVTRPTPGPMMPGAPPPGSRVPANVPMAKPVAK